MDDAVGTLTAFWGHIKAQLSPELIACKSNNIAALPEPPNNTLAFLHTLCAHGRKEELCTKKYEGCALWVRGGDLHSHVLPASPSMILEYDTIAVTKAGNLAVMKMDDPHAFILSIDNGNVLHKFDCGKGEYTAFIAVDLEGRIWTWTLCYSYVNCFSVEGQLLYKIDLEFYLFSIAFFSDGRMLFSGQAKFRPVVVFFSPNCEQIIKTCSSRLSHLGYQGLSCDGQDL